VLKRVGTPFFTTRAQGTGLGLAQCQRLIGTAGGRLAIDSEPGKGTTVTITLPISA
jgi:signal transduction histidine kinase